MRWKTLTSSPIYGLGAIGTLILPSLHDDGSFPPPRFCTAPAPTCGAPPLQSISFSPSKTTIRNPFLREAAHHLLRVTLTVSASPAYRHRIQVRGLRSCDLLAARQITAPSDFHSRSEPYFHVPEDSRAHALSPYYRLSFRHPRRFSCAKI